MNDFHSNPSTIDQIAAAVNRCSVTNLAVVKPKVQSQNVKESIRVEALNGEYKVSAQIEKN